MWVKEELKMVEAFVDWLDSVKKKNIQKQFQLTLLKASGELLEER